MGDITFELDVLDENDKKVKKTISIDDNTEALVLSNREVAKALNDLLKIMRFR